jgi:transcriptional regulator with XRE-family HTH domain
MNNYPLTHAPAMLRDMRTTAGLTQPELARRLGRFQQSVSRHERDGYHVSTDTIRAVADVCGVNVTLVTEKR